jgi:hypothetical protein
LDAAPARAQCERVYHAGRFEDLVCPTSAEVN